MISYDRKEERKSQTATRNELYFSSSTNLDFVPIKSPIIRPVRPKTFHSTEGADMRTSCI